MKIHRENLKLGRTCSFAYQNSSSGGGCTRNPTLSKLNFC